MSNNIKKISFILFTVFFLVGCSQENSEKNEFYSNILSNYKFDENTLVSLDNKNSSADMSICANNDLDLITMSNSDYVIDTYYKGNQEYIYVNKNGYESYYLMDITVLYDNPMDIYEEMVFLNTNISSILYMGDETVDGIDCANVSCKIGSNSCNVYFSLENNQLVRLSYIGGNKLNFSKSELVLPEEFETAKKVDADFINDIISDFQNSSN